MKLWLRQGEMMGTHDNKEKRREEGNEVLQTPKKNVSIQIQSPFPFLASGRHSSNSVFATRKFTSSHTQMNQVHRLFNKHAWLTTTGKPHKFHWYQIQKSGLKFTFAVPY